MRARTAIFLLLAMLIMAQSAIAQSLQNLAESRRDCAACHLEWSPDFEQPGAVLLMDKPTISMAPRETTCLGCHDGSVRDSRKKVWQEQSHKSGITPPVSMKVPDRLPLEDGKLACRTCHTAHNQPGGENFSTTFFLRVENDQSQLCKMCHTEKSAGPTHGSHPVGPMPIGLPASLIAAGGKSGPTEQELICQSCHEPHGSKVDRLLVLPVTDNQLCLSCHEKLRPEQWGAAGHTHPIDAPLSTDAQRQAVIEMKTRTAPGGKLACLSCHRLHDSPPQNGHLLADTLTDAKLCLRCHPGRDTVAGTLHDLRKTAPTTRNALGQTPTESGPCGACHLPHRAARPPMVANGDPQGACLACHATGRLAAKAGATQFNHPQNVTRAKLPDGLALAVSLDTTDPSRANVTCMTCHDPHDGSKTKFLRKRPDDLCGTCHLDQKSTLAGSHDFNNHPTAVNGLGKTVAQTGKCGFCHDVHRGNGPAIWIATATPPTHGADMCLSCHNTTGLAARHPAPRFSHPTEVAFPATQPTAVLLPLFTAAGQRTQTQGVVQCASCHNPHADSRKSSLMLRVQGNTSELCLHCHGEKASLHGGIHDSKTNPAWPAAKAGNDLCMACHQAHSNDPEKKLWTVAPAPGVVTADGVCIACHPTKRWADPNDPSPAAGAMMHPQIIPTTRPATGAEAADVTVADCALPLVPSMDSPARTRIGCKTCHNPHSGREVPQMLRVIDPTQPQTVCFNCHKKQSALDHSMHARNILIAATAANPILAPADAKRVCAPCHGVHAVDGSQHDKLWAFRTDSSGVTANEQRCLGCHDDQAAKRPAIPVHPQVVFDLLKWTAADPSLLPAYLPTDQSFACSICHLPHGQKDIPTIALTAAADGLPVNTMIPLRGATKPMLRASVPQTLCRTCHGADAQRVFLYYHHPEQRQDVKGLQNPGADSDE